MCVQLVKDVERTIPPPQLPASLPSLLEPPLPTRSNRIQQQAPVSLTGGNFDSHANGKPQASNDRGVSNNSESDDGQPDVYDRFSRARKRMIVAVISFAGLLAPFASSSFFPAIPQISADLGISQAVTNYTVAIYLIVLGVAPLAWSPYSTLYGRQRIYLISLPIFVAGSIGVAESRSLVALIMTRTIQGIGSSSVLAVGAGSIGDIYRPTERGGAMGLYYAGALLGPSVAPVVAGIMTEYVHGSHGSWRAFQYLLAAMGAVVFLLTVAFLPETSHHCGIEDVRASRALLQGTKETKQWIWVWLNPLRPLKLLRHRNVLAISLTSSFVLLSTYAILVPLTYTLGPRYGITNEAVLGTLYLAQGGGYIVGSRISGYFSDFTVARWIVRRSGLFIPEDRLRASIVAAGLITPLSMVAAGLTMQFWTSAGGLAMSLVFLFIGGIGLMGTFAVCTTYLVDIMEARSAEVIATNNCVRYIAAAGASAVVLPIIEAIGVAPTNAIAAVTAWIGFALVCATIKYGRGWREAGHELKA